MGEVVTITEIEQDIIVQAVKYHMTHSQIEFGIKLQKAKNKKSFKYIFAGPCS